MAELVWWMKLERFEAARGTECSGRLELFHKAWVIEGCPILSPHGNWSED